MSLAAQGVPVMEPHPDLSEEGSEPGSTRDVDTQPLLPPGKPVPSCCVGTHTFVCVHGAWHGGWCFYKVAALLQARGHTVLTPDLPGHGVNRDIGGSLWGYCQSICKILDAATQPVVLLGHSMGGAIISQVAEQRPTRIKRLVYLSGLLLQHGESVLQVALGDWQSPLSQATALNEEDDTLALDPGLAAAFFYDDCSPPDIRLAQQLLVPEPLRAMYTPLQISVERFGSIPRTFIRCERDQVLPPALQERMCVATPCQQILSLDCGHSPFFSAAEDLVEKLLALA